MASKLVWSFKTLLYAEIYLYFHVNVKRSKDVTVRS